VAGRSGDQIPVGARFSTPLQTGLEAHPTSYIMGNGPGRGVGYPPHPASRLKKE